MHQRLSRNSCYFHPTEHFSYEHNSRRLIKRTTTTTTNSSPRSAKLDFIVLSRIIIAVSSESNIRSVCHKRFCHFRLIRNQYGAQLRMCLTVLFVDWNVKTVVCRYVLVLNTLLAAKLYLRFTISQNRLCESHSAVTATVTTHLGIYSRRITVTIHLSPYPCRCMIVMRSIIN